MNQRDGFSSLNKRPLPIDSSCYEYNFQSFRQNANPSQNSQHIFNTQSSSSLYNQFITDCPLNGSLKNDNEMNLRFNQASNNTPRNNFTFFDEEPPFQHQYNQQQNFFNNEENQPEQKLESNNNKETTYDDIAFQAQQLLDKINSIQDFNDQPEISLNHKPSSNNYSQNNNHATSQSSPPIRLQPILQNSNFFKNRNSNQNLQNQNQRKIKPPVSHIRNLNQCQHNNFNSDSTNQFSQSQNNSQTFEFNQRQNNSQTFEFNQRQNNSQTFEFNQRQNNENDVKNMQKPPQATFASPIFLLNNFEPNTKRLNTASEMVYPDNHIELIHHSYES